MGAAAAACRAAEEATGATKPNEVSAFSLRAAKSLERVEKLGRHIASATEDLGSLQELVCRAEEQFESFRKLQSDLDEEAIGRWAQARTCRLCKR